MKRIAEIVFYWWTVNISFYLDITGFYIKYFTLLSQITTFEL
jgi:hypothetical protein